MNRGEAGMPSMMRASCNQYLFYYFLRFQEVPRHPPKDQPELELRGKNQSDSEFVKRWSPFQYDAEHGIHIEKEVKESKKRKSVFKKVSKTKKQK